MTIRVEGKLGEMPLPGDGHFVFTLGIYLVGLVGNVVAVTVWSVHIKGTRVLLVLSVCDCLAIVANVANIVSELARQPCVAMLAAYVADLLFAVCSYVSVVVIVHRYVCVAFPYSVSRWCSSPRQAVCVAVVVLLAALPHLGYSALKAEEYDLCHRDEVAPADILERHLLCLFVFGVISLLTSIVILVFNLLLVYALRRRKVRGSLRRQHARTTLRASLTALWVSTTMLLTTSLMTLANVFLVVYFTSLDQNVKDVFLMIALIRDICVALTLSVNVFFYSYLCPSFRDAVVRWMEAAWLCGYGSMSTPPGPLLCRRRHRSCQVLLPNASGNAFPSSDPKCSVV